MWNKYKPCVNLEFKVYYDCFNVNNKVLPYTVVDKHKTVKIINSLMMLWLIIDATEGLKQLCSLQVISSKWICDMKLWNQLYMLVVADKFRVFIEYFSAGIFSSSSMWCSIMGTALKRWVSKFDGIQINDWTIFEYMACM